MARLLADENVPGRLVEALRERGHDVRWARTDARGSADVLGAIERGAAQPGKFTVVEEERVRMIPLP